jgi:nucleotide-binding universal stress UspA family protein
VRVNALLAVDLSRDAAEVIAAARPWIDRLGLRVDLVYVDTTRAALERWTPPAFRSELDRRIGEEEARMADLLASLPEARRGQWFVDVSELDDMITRRSPDYGLVIVGTRGRTGLAHLWAGSVAEHVIRLCPRSVLVVRGHELPEHPRVLFAVDLGAEPEALATALERFASRLDAQVDLLHVQETGAWLPPFEAPGMATALAEHAAEVTREKLGVLTSVLGQFAPERRGRAEVVAGVPAAEIVARSGDADLVVVGTHGRAGIAHAVLGSVAERVVRRVARPVLVLRA